MKCILGAPLLQNSFCQKDINLGYELRIYFFFDFKVYFRSRRNIGKYTDGIDLTKKDKNIFDKTSCDILFRIKVHVSLAVAFSHLSHSFLYLRHQFDPLYLANSSAGLGAVAWILESEV